VFLEEVIIQEANGPVPAELECSLGVDPLD
jgi:hypothetical protein